MPSSGESLREIGLACQAGLEAVQQAPSLALMVLAALRLGMLVAARVVEAVLAERAQRRTQWPACPGCGRQLRSKGFAPRQMDTLLGAIRWRRRVGRCPDGCDIGQVAPLDEELGIAAGQCSSVELQEAGCALAVFVPFETAAALLMRLTGVAVSAGTVWGWVQAAGARAMAHLKLELDALESGEMPAVEAMPEETAALPLVIGADGVMVPFRPEGGKPRGRTAWHEVKVAVLTRLGLRRTRRGEDVPHLEQRRLVAVRGDVAALQPRLWLEALRQGIRDAKLVAWVSDGARGLWGLFEARFAGHAVGILDFYHAAQNLWKGATAWLDGRTKAAREWFRSGRHRLRHGDQESVLADVAAAMELDGLSASARRTLASLYKYLEKHRKHLDYQKFKELGLPLGSGMVESACKWLIQQRFKGVGMRWSEDGFDHLLHLRLAWVNGRFDGLFLLAASPN